MMELQEIGRKQVLRYFWGGTLVMAIYILAISHNIAWLNPYPGQNPTARPSTQVPYGWEYNLDSGLELYSSLDFPYGMQQEKLRIARPLKNAIISVGVNIVNIAHPLGFWEKVGVAYVLHHVMVLALLASAFYFLVCLANRHGVPLEGVLFCWVWLILNEPFRWAESHTFVFQVSNSIFLMAIVQRLADIRKDYTRNAYQGIVFLYMFLAGFMLLIKQDLAPFLALLGFALAMRLWRYLPVGCAAVALPYLLYRWDLKMADIPWYSHETAVYGQSGGWFTSILQHQGIGQALCASGNLFNCSLTTFYSTFGLLLLLGVIGLWTSYAGRLSSPRPLWLGLALFLIGGTFVQVWGANRPLDYMFYDAFPAIAFLAAIGYSQLQSARIGKLSMRKVFILYLIIHGSLKLINCLHFPWKNPLG